MKIQSVNGALSFRGIDVLKLEGDKTKPAQVLALMDEDTFERSNLPEMSDVENLEGPYGHPYSGRPIIRTIIEHKDEIKDVVDDVKESLDDDDKEGILEFAIDLIKGLLGLDD